MPRPPSYTEAEDRIILKYAGEPIEVVNAALERAGFDSRTATQVNSRRYYLRSKDTSQVGPDATLDQLNTRLEEVQSQRTDLAKECAALHKEDALLKGEEADLLSQIKATATRMADAGAVDTYEVD